MNKPLVSVLMPTFNADYFIEESVRSITNQTYHNLQIIIIDDGSTDKTSNIINQFKDNRIRFIKHEKNQGLIFTLNEGIKLCTGKYIARMDADDISELNRIECQVDFMEDHPDVGILGTAVQNIGTFNNIVRYPQTDDEIRWKILYTCCFSHPSVMLRTFVIRKFNLEYNPVYDHAEDYELWPRLLQYCKGYNLETPLLRYRIHPKNVSKLYEQTQLQNSLLVIQQQFHRMGLYITFDEVKLFREFANSNFSFDAHEIHLLTSLIDRIILNKKMPEYSKRMIVQRLWHLMQNNKNISWNKKYSYFNNIKSFNSSYLPGFWEIKSLLKHIILKLS